MINYTALDCWKQALLLSQCANITNQLTFRQKMALMEEANVELFNNIINLNENYYTVTSFPLQMLSQENGITEFALPKNFYHEVSVHRKVGSSFIDIQRENIISRDGGYIIYPDKRTLELHSVIAPDIYLTYLRHPHDITFPAPARNLPGVSSSNPSSIRLQLTNPLERFLYNGTERALDGTARGGAAYNYLYTGNQIITVNNQIPLSGTSGRYRINNIVYPEDITIDQFTGAQLESTFIRRYGLGWIVNDADNNYFLITGDSDNPNITPLDLLRDKTFVVTDNFIVLLESSSGKRNELYLLPWQAPRIRLNFSATNDLLPNTEALYDAAMDPNTGMGIAIKDGNDGQYKMISYFPDTILDLPMGVSWNYLINSVAIKILKYLDKTVPDNLLSASELLLQNLLNEASVNTSPVNIARTRTIISRSYY